MATGSLVVLSSAKQEGSIRKACMYLCLECFLVLDDVVIIFKLKKLILTVERSQKENLISDLQSNKFYHLIDVYEYIFRSGEQK